MRQLLQGALLCFFSITASCQEQVNGVQKLTATEFKEKLEATTNQQLVDVRTPAEYNEGHLNNAVNMNISDPAFKTQVTTLDKSKPVYVYCLGGGRSASATAMLKENGFTQVFDMKGGIMAWKNNGLAVIGGKENGAADKFTAADFDKMLADNPVVLVDFYATWCTPCKKMEPVLTRLAKEYQGKVLIYRLNIEEAKAVTAALKVEGIPVFHLYKQGKLLRSVNGEQDEKAIRAMIATAQ
jgi:thioredoxin 1